MQKWHCLRQNLDSCFFLRFKKSTVHETWKPKEENRKHRNARELNKLNDKYLTVFAMNWHGLKLKAFYPRFMGKREGEGEGRVPVKLYGSGEFYSLGVLFVSIFASNFGGETWCPVACGLGLTRCPLIWVWFQLS